MEDSLGEERPVRRSRAAGQETDREEKTYGAQCEGYWVAISGEKAERILTRESEGSFVERRKDQAPAIAVKLGGRVRHIRIECRENKLRFANDPRLEERGLKGLIERGIETSRTGKHLFTLDRERNGNPMRLRLLNPIMREGTKDERRTHGLRTKGRGRDEERNLKGDERSEEGKEPGGMKGKREDQIGQHK